MKIVAINTTDYGSTGTIMLQVASMARQAGHTVYTYSKKWRDKGLGGEYHRYLGSKIGNIFHRVMGPRTGKNECFSKASTKKLIRELKRIDPDIIHLHNLHGWYLNLDILFSFIKKKNIQVVWTLHDCWAFTGHCTYFDMVECDKWKNCCDKCPCCKEYPEMYKDYSQKQYQWKKEWFTGVENLTIVTPSKWLAEHVRSSFLKDYPVQVIYNGIDLNDFSPKQSEFRDKYDIGNKKLIMGVAFDWGKRKGLDVFSSLSESLSEKYQIVLVGTNEEIDRELPKNIISIHRTQSRQQLAEIYSAADLFVNPTREEVLGLVNIEALACGTPVVTFRSGGSPECIDESCGVVVEKNDVEEMEKQIKRVCEDKPFTKKACVARAKQFDKKNKFNEYVKLYEKLKG